MQIRAKELRALDIIPPIEFLVDAVRRVRGAAHGQQQHVLARGALERQRHGDAAALARQVGLHAEHALHRARGGGKVPVVRARDPPVTRVLQLDLEGVLAVEISEGGSDVCEDERVDFFAVHVWYRPDGEFADDFGGDDGFGTGAGEGAFHAVDAQTWVPPARHEGGFLVGVDARLAAKTFMQIRHGITDVLVQRLFLVTERCYHVVDARDQDLAVRLNKASEYAHEICHGFLR